MPDVRARLDAKTQREPGDGCWIYVGHRKTPSRQHGAPSVLGYGQIWHNGRARRAHVVAYELAHGAVPAGFVVGHACDNPPCVRPSHLAAISLGDNLRDAWARGRRRRTTNTET